MYRTINCFKLCLEFLRNLIILFSSNIAATNKCFCIKCTSSALCINQLVHLWLCETWLVTFVVTATAVANKINHNIFLKCLAIFKCPTRNANTSFRIITIYMEDRCINHLGNIR